MKWFFALLIGGVVLALYLGYPDIKRYLEMRRM